MIGNNRLHLNPSQMAEALEYYLKEVMFKDGQFKVAEIHENKNNGYFEVALETPDETT